MQTSGKIKVTDLNNLLTCVLCKGYYIDATTIIECLHSFCRTCIVRYLQSNKYCPTCEVQVHKTKPLVNIRSDQTLQDIVYKLVPGLFKNEMKRRRDFYSQKDMIPANIPSSSEKRGDIWGCDRLIFTPEDDISLSLERYPLNEPLPLNLQTNIFPTESLCSNGIPNNGSNRRYFRCPGAMSIYHMKKLLRAKHNLRTNKKVDILYMHDILKEDYMLIDLAYIYSWKRSEPLRLFYKIIRESKKRPADYCEIEENTQIIIPAETNSSLNLSTTFVESPISSLAATPTSRHSTRPPSPKMAEEPKDISLEKPNCASISLEKPNCVSLLGKQDLKVGTELSSVKTLKSVLKKSVFQNPKPTGTIPVLQNGETLKNHYVNKPVILPNDRTLQNSSLPICNFPKKKKVTFSVDLVKNCYHTITLKRIPKYDHNLISLKPVNRTPINNAAHARNRVVLENKSS